MRFLPEIPDESSGKQIIPSPANGSAAYPVLKRMNKLGKKADRFANGVREHGKILSSSISLVK